MTRRPRFDPRPVRDVICGGQAPSLECPLKCERPKTTFTKLEHRSWIKIEVTRGRSAQECVKHAALPYRTVTRWVKAFREVRDAVQDNLRTARPRVEDNTVQLLASLLDSDRRWTALAQALLDRYQRKDYDFIGRIVTMGETWARSYEPNLKRQSNEWKHPGSSRPKKVRSTQSAVKEMFIVACDIAGNPIILHDNARTHTAAAVNDLLRRWQWEILEHLPYSADMSPSDYDLFTKVKEPLRGTRYNTRDELIRALGRSIRNIIKDGRADGVRRFPNIWQKHLLKYCDSDVRFELTTSVPQESRSRGLHGALRTARGGEKRVERAYAARMCARATAACRVKGGRTLPTLREVRRSGKIGNSNFPGYVAVVIKEEARGNSDSVIHD
ncbi:hypothetical protein ANN_27263 [Periplaneta americana]|uniref:Tc1-like transposase DDE domain-containing protein n=1 Tax=Periplaneta americana TaxID=6978 RepID=A0ABQ8RXM1_PERAM|nr:hypothetical protein ANN_27263 [Periplaneta americana]